MRDVVAEMFACRGIHASDNTKIFRGTAGLRALNAAVRVTTAQPDEALLAISRHEFRDSALTLVQALGSPVTLRVRCGALQSNTELITGPGSTGRAEPVHCVLSGYTGENGSYDPATMAVSWVFDSISEFDWVIDEGEAALVVSVPDEAIADYVEADHEAPLLVRAPRCTIAPAIAGFALALVNDAGTSAAARTPVADYAIDRFLQEMTGIVLVENRGATMVQRGPRRQLYFEAAALITELYADPALGPADLAAALNVSVRTLQQAFQEAGSRVSAEIRSQRARAARSLLAEPKYDVLSLGQIAAHCGYRSTETLREGLKTHYAMTPRELRSSRSGVDAHGSPDQHA